MAKWNGDIAKIALPTPFAVGDVNVYVVKGDALTLIDTGVKTKRSKEALTQGLADLGLELSDIEQIILTHHHPDHAGALDFFAKEIPVYGHKNNQRWLDISDDFLETHNCFFLEYATKFGVAEELKDKLIHHRDDIRFLSERKLQGYLAEGDELPGLPGWKTIETPGHAQSHLSFYRESDGVMIAGDHLLAKISPNPLMEPPILPGDNRPRPLLQYNASLQKLLGFSISTVYSGHGDEVNGDAVADLIQYRFERQHNRAMQVKNMLSIKPLSVFEVCQQLFPKVYLQEVGLTLSETIGQLDYLEDLGEVETAIEAGVILYSIA
ncbi:MBL fold metallo-hydrolase [Peribacillus muralis]|uniref:MBL fold metallo-hydrolase n=1 Tax=Peribacillus muralis TaxID=264697 RepID=UPI001F4E6BF7|nr:MBL fold metallo-hydrolase [Peribacillus muralis]MCK1991413.1 MBL fold metallo-hydrolase [Peribacillus muralis]MCK2011968.1 MBL fold metallo-hydrolase [Peribacillus muralis]